MSLSFDNIIYPGFQKAIKGQGMPNPKQQGIRGDLRIQFLVKFPSQLTQQQRDEAATILQDCCSWYFPSNWYRFHLHVFGIRGFKENIGKIILWSLKKFISWFIMTQEKADWWSMKKRKAFTSKAVLPLKFLLLELLYWLVGQRIECFWSDFNFYPFLKLTEKMFSIVKNQFWKFGKPCSQK